MADQMSGPIASPNDPAFIIHHTMVDCIFNEWLKCHPDVTFTFGTRGNQVQS